MADGFAARYEPAAREALRAFGIGTARLQLIGISENVTYRADEDRSGEAYVLRLHRPGYHTLDELNSERVWLEALRDSGISVPTPVDAPDGRYFVPVFWGPFWENPVLEERERELLITARDHCRERLRRYGEPRRTFSMIHADLHLANLLAHDGQLSVIDFDDAGLGWHQYDIAVAMFHSRDTSDFRAARQAFLHSYRAVRPISDDDLALVPMFELIRGMAILGWRAQRPEVPWPDGQLEMFRKGVIAGCERLLRSQSAPT